MKSQVEKIQTTIAELKKDLEETEAAINRMHVLNNHVSKRLDNLEIDIYKTISRKNSVNISS